MRAESIRKIAAFGLSGDPFVLGTQEPDSRSYNPTQIGKDFAAFCKMNGFRCTFHDLRHTFATMMIAAGTDVRTVASHLGHASISMTLNIYADVDPDAKKAVVSKVNDCFDVDMTAASPIECDLFGNEPAPQPRTSPSRLTSWRPCSPRPGPSRQARRKVTICDLTGFEVATCDLKDGRDGTLVQS